MVSRQETRRQQLVRRLMRAFTPVHRWIYHMSRGRIGTTWTTAGMPVLLLTTTGRRTGTPRTHPVGYIPEDDRLVVIASKCRLAEASSLVPESL